MKDGEKYDVGDTFPAGDECNKWYVRNFTNIARSITIIIILLSMCLTGGNIACTEMACCKLCMTYRHVYFVYACM